MVEDGLIGTIIVKDLSRFGREQIEMGRLLQIVYPSLGVTFISIQEGVNTTTKTGIPLVPFVNIFNEWYAEQTSQKIRAVWKSKAEHGKSVSVVTENGCTHLIQPAVHRLRGKFQKHNGQLQGS